MLADTPSCDTVAPSELVQSELLGIHAAKISYASSYLFDVFLSEIRLNTSSFLKDKHVDTNAICNKIDSTVVKLVALTNAIGTQLRAPFSPYVETSGGVETNPEHLFMQDECAVCMRTDCKAGTGADVCACRKQLICAECEQQMYTSSDYSCPVCRQSSLPVTAEHFTRQITLVDIMWLQRDAMHQEIAHLIRAATIKMPDFDPEYRLKGDAHEACVSQDAFIEHETAKLDAMARTAHRTQLLAFCCARHLLGLDVFRPRGIKSTLVQRNMLKPIEKVDATTKNLVLRSVAYDCIARAAIFVSTLRNLIGTKKPQQAAFFEWLALMPSPIAFQPTQEDRLLLTVKCANCATTNDDGRGQVRVQARLQPIDTSEAAASRIVCLHHGNMASCIAHNDAYTAVHIVLNASPSHKDPLVTALRAAASHAKHKLDMAYQTCITS